MSAATTNRVGSVIPYSSIDLPVKAATKIVGGTIVCTDASGWAVSATATTGLRPWGRSTTLADNTSGANGEIVVNVKLAERIEVTLWENDAGSPVTAAMRGQRVYMLDNQTLTASASGNSAGPYVYEVTAEGVWAWFETAGSDPNDPVAGEIPLLDSAALYAASTVEAAFEEARTQLALKAMTELTIAGGAVTATQSLHRVDTESDAASDDLDTIAGTASGKIYLVRPESAARAVVIRDTGGGTGNIRTPYGKSITLSAQTDWAALISDGTNLTVFAFRTAAGNGGGAGAIVGLLSALTTTEKGTVVGAINEVKANAIAAPAYQAGTATLASGTITVNTGITVAANSRVIPLLIGDITGSTNFASLRERKASRVNGAPGVGTIVLDAVGADGLLDADAAGAIDYVILTPQS